MKRAILIGVVLTALGAGCKKKDSGSTTPGSYTETASGLNLEMVHVDRGEFMMGSPSTDPLAYEDEFPAHRVTLPGYYIGRFEVTQAQWETVMGTNPSRHVGCPDCPVENVSFLDVREFISRLNAVTGKTYRLPSEAEWEHACRAGSTTRYHFGDQEAELPRHSWSVANAGGATHPVGQRAPNAWGLYDLYGNVEEWVEDWYDDGYYASSPVSNPINDDSLYPLKVNRGGSYKDKAWLPRSAYRMWNAPDHRFDGLGFRLARSVP